MKLVEFFKGFFNLDQVCAHRHVLLHKGVVLKLADLVEGSEGDFRDRKLKADEIKSVGAALHPRVVKLDFDGCGLGDSGAVLALYFFDRGGSQ